MRLHGCSLFLLCLLPFDAIAQTSNPIVVENQQPGTSLWQLYRPGFPVADDIGKQIKGYASATSVNKGNPITFYVTVSPAQNYTIDIYRIGWYQGLGGRLMQHIGPLFGTIQPACPVDASTGLIECNWSPGSIFTVPSSWTTGIYLAVLTNSQNYQNYINFVVRDDSSHSSLLYQESVNTAQAYNNYPNDSATGKSLYNYNSNGANTVSGNPRAVKVSFDRPYANTGVGDFLSWEVYFGQWLESVGYDVSYSTDVDTHANGAQILNHKAFLSVGHNEYWSKPMRTAVEQARDTGVNIGFFGADTSYWQVRLEASTAAGVPNRVVVCYKTQPIDPVQGPTTTTSWRSAFLALPEQTMVGLGFTAENLPSYTSPPNTYVVTNSSNWVYAGTGLKDGDGIPLVVGYEVDRYNSLYPAPSSIDGSYTLLSHSPVIDVNSGLADYANSSIYQAPSGAWVFGAGTVDWAWGLSRTGFIDARLQQTTTNILNRFIGLSAAPPVIISQFPAVGAIGFAIGEVDITFNRAMNAATVNSSSFTLRAAGATSNIAASIFSSGASASLIPLTSLGPGTTYTVTVAGSVTDSSGIALGTPVTWSFTTAGSAQPAPVIISRFPAAGATGVISGEVDVTFDRAMNASTLNASSFTLHAAGAASNVAASIFVSGAATSLIPSGALTAATTYTATIAGTVTDTSGVALGSALTWTFTTR